MWQFICASSFSRTYVYVILCVHILITFCLQMGETDADHVRTYHTRMLFDVMSVHITHKHHCSRIYTLKLPPVKRIKCHAGTPFFFRNMLKIKRYFCRRCLIWWQNMNTRNRFPEISKMDFVKQDKIRIKN